MRKQEGPKSLLRFISHGSTELQGMRERERELKRQKMEVKNTKRTTERRKAKLDLQSID